MIETEIDNMIYDMETRLSYQGIKLNKYLEMIGKKEEDIRKEYEQQAKDAIKSRLTVEAIVKEEKIEATDEEIDEKIKEMAKNYGKKEEELKDNENIRKYIKQGIESEKVVEFLVENAKVKNKK